MVWWHHLHLTVMTGSFSSQSLIFISPWRGCFLPDLYSFTPSFCSHHAYVCCCKSFGIVPHPKCRFHSQNMRASSIGNQAGTFLKGKYFYSKIFSGGKYENRTPKLWNKDNSFRVLDFYRFSFV